MYKEKTERLFASPAGERIYSLFEAAVCECKMREHIEKGTLVGLSGGADSVMLTLLLLEYKRREGIASPILAVHVNHGIRGEEAERDECFAREFARSLGIEFNLRRIDVPSLAKESGRSLEEEAREARYLCFTEIIRGRKDVFSIALGHNATDNLETVIFNMMRGSGLRGACGIPPVRDNIFRPMLYIPKADIVSTLCDGGIDFVTDSTNKDTAYTRNYIRHEIIPRLTRLAPLPEQSVTRLTRNLRCDCEYIDSAAHDFISACNGKPSARSLTSLHPAVLSRAISALVLEASGKALERVHITKICELLPCGAFSYSLPGGFRFVSSCGICSVEKTEENSLPVIPIVWGINELAEYSAEVQLFVGKPEISHNVYKFAIQADLSSAIIEGDLYIRSKREGDSYFYGGMTRKLKKLFVDRKISRSDRERIPVLCDDKGIVWVAGFGVRDDGVRGEPRGVRISYDKSDNRSFYIPLINKMKGTVDT